MNAKRTDRKHCFLPLKRGKSMWPSLVRSVPLYSLHNQVCHMDFSRSLISSGWHLPESGRFLTWKCPSEKDTPLKNKQQPHSCDKNHRNETACCPSRAVVCLRLQTPVRPRKYDKIITNTVLYPLRHPTCFGTSLYKKPYYLHRQQGQTTKQTEKETHTEAAPDTLLPNLQIRMYSLRKT